MNNQTPDLAGAGACPLGGGAMFRARVGRISRILCLCLLVTLTLAAKSCKSENLFKSNFEVTAFNQQPATTQAVGTAEFSGPPGSVLVVPAPPNASPPAKWLRIIRPNDPAQISIFRAKLTRQPGDGFYVFSAVLVIPDGNTGPASIQFETATGEGFLHLDFMPAGNIRIDDDTSTIFGTFARNQAFLVQVTLNISATSAKANIALAGAGASGNVDRTIIPAFRLRARQFGAVRLFMGFPHVGTFHAANVVVSRKS